MAQLAGEERIPPLSPSFSDRCKRVFLGRPMINDQLQHERLSNPVASGCFLRDAISSTAYGTEQIMIELLPAAGMAAFALLLPITGVILFDPVARGCLLPPGGDRLHPGRRFVRGRAGELRTRESPRSLRPRC